MKRLFAALLCLVLVVSLLPQQGSAVSVIEQVTLSLEYPVAGKAPAEAAWYGQGYSVYETQWHDRNDDCYLEPGDKIQADHAYEVTIWVEADSGYAFNAANDYTPTVSATVNGASAEVGKAYEYKAWAMITVTYDFDHVPEKGWISSVDLTIPAPVTGAKPYYTQISTPSYESSNVYFSGNTDPNMKNGISWYYTATGEQIVPDSSDIYLPNTGYTFHCLIFPNEGYRITREARVRVNGELAEAKLDYAAFLSVMYDFPDTEAHAPNNHTPSDWRTTGAYHYKVCTTCGDFLEQEDHLGGKATCEDDGVCTVCGYAYIQAGEEYHVPDTSKWSARGDMYHFHKCSICGAHCDIEDHRWSPKPHVADASGHAYQCADCMACDKVQPHNPGPAATETAPQTCKDCGYIIAPAINHKHQLTKVAQVLPTCTEAGVLEHYVCSGCSDKFLDAAGTQKVADDASLAVQAQGHAQSDTWSFNAQEHWRICDTCRQPLVETQMEHDLQEGKCDVCGYTDGSADPTGATVETAANGTQEQPTQQPDSDISTQPDNSGKTENAEDLGWLLPVLIGLVCFAAALTATVLILKRRKHKA